MNSFDLVGVSARRRLPRWLPPIGGLLAAGLVVFLLYPLPRPHSLSPEQLIASAILRVVAALLANAGAVWVLCAISPKKLGSNNNSRLLILATSLNALWLAPLALLLQENSLWTLAITAALAAGIVKSIRLAADLAANAEAAAESDAEDPLIRAPASNIFSLLESSPSFRQQCWGAGVVLCAQAGVLTSFAGYPLSAALLVGASSSVWASAFLRDPSHRFSTSSHSSSRALLFLSLAIVFTAAGLVPYLRPTYGIRGLGLPNFARYMPSRGDRRGEQGRRRTPEGSLAPASDGDPGIILLPNHQTITKLIAPAPVIANALLTAHGSAKPLEIPFEGVYWFFRAPDLHPPRSSRQAHGSPEALDIHSTDWRPLSMEARESLGSTIDLDCCSRIQIAIRNADHYPQTVSLELVLINSTLPGKPFQSLGSIMVTSSRPWRPEDKRSPANETLNFSLPRKPSLRRFDEVRIIFRIASVRADFGPKIAIDRLVLIPRGL
jgi:hypothetical protein